MKRLIILILPLILTGCNFDKETSVLVLPTNNGSIEEAREEEDQKEKQVKNEDKNILVFPVDDFKNRITKKSFGDYITPKNSSVQPERFNGYHTGVDVEYEDVEVDVLVRSIADGIVLYSGWISDYGGVVVVNHEIEENNYTVIYGHIKQLSLIKKGIEVIAGEQIGVLGEGRTRETDGERKHLHFGLYKGGEINFKGYVQNEDELSRWLDPLIVFK
jgi:murein DD-endopeptidase MepM/ murein hydrolase activator NlpD